MADTVTNTKVFGYWAIGSDGKIYPFGDAVKTGELAAPALTTVDIEAAPHGNGYWSMDNNSITALT